LNKAAKGAALAKAGKLSKQAPTAGHNRSEGVQDDSEKEPSPTGKPPSPSLADVESSMAAQGLKSQEENAQSTKAEKDGQSGLGLPQTTLLGPDNSKEKDSPEQDATEPTTQEELDKALEEQMNLLAEFEKVSDELNAILANLEGSTLVKRLKSVSREQSLIADRLASQLNRIFGILEVRDEETRSTLDRLATAEQNSGQSLSYIMDDMQAFYNRRRTNEFKSVLDEMKSTDVLSALQNLADDLMKQHGLAIARIEYWADTLDRWAEDLVPPPKKSDGEEDKKKQESKSNKPSIPPKLILEMLKILEGEVNLREETRVAQQARIAVAEDIHQKESVRLSQIQAQLRERIEMLSGELANLPNAEEAFAAELQLFGAVSLAMQEARFQLDFGETGPTTIAAETEAIELLLQSQRINPKGGGGGTGTSPGGGGTGSTDQSALALLGTGINQNERQEARDVGQAQGQSSTRVLPEEFRAGLDAYFQQLEQQ
jgi:hypothetical protein